MKNKEKDKIKVIAINKKAKFDYEVIQTYEAGIVLLGTEVKAVRAAAVSFADCYAKIKNNEVWIINMHIGEYKFGNIFNHQPKRTRKLLLHKREIRKIAAKIKEYGYSLIPLKIYLKNGLVKIEIGICKGKKLFDKREAIKNRDANMELKKLAKNY